MYSKLYSKKWLLLSATALFMAQNPIQAQQKVPAYPITDMDHAAHACDDFDQFANGGWKKSNPIPSTESRWGAFGILDKENKDVRIKGIIAEILAQPNLKKGTEAQQIADFYRAYSDVATLNKLGIKPIQKYVDQINAVKTVKEWTKLTGSLDMIGVDGVLGFGIYADKKNSKWNAIYAGQSGLSLGEKGFYSRDDSSAVNIRKEFAGHINKMFALAGWKDKSPGENILRFETALAALQLSNVELRDPVKTYNKVAYAEMKKLVKDFDLDGYLSHQGFKIDEVILQNKEYLSNLNTLLNNTPVETLKQYSRWQLLSSFAGYLSEDLQNEDFRFGSTVMRGVKQRKSLEERATTATNGIMGMPLGKLFAAKYFPESSKQKVAEMIENVRTVFGERIDQLSWMSPETKVEARKKLAAFTYKIGYPDQWKDYSTIDIKPNTLVDNVISARAWGHKESINKIGKEVDKKEWGMSPQTVNAYYSPLNNEVVFPAGILQPPFFNPDADDAINYGGIIAVIGHEFSHGFDDKGSKYDAEGNMKNWWTEEDRQKFDELANKYIAYFDKREALPGLNVNGKLTIGENIADLGGLTLAYHALQKSMKGKPEPAPIDGFTWQQRFFLGWAQVWHTNITDAALRQQVLTDPHSPAADRINGPMPHLIEFHNAWGTKESNKLYLPAADRIVIW